MALNSFQQEVRDRVGGVLRENQLGDPIAREAVGPTADFGDYLRLDFLFLEKTCEVFVYDDGGGIHHAGRSLVFEREDYKSDDEVADEMISCVRRLLETGRLVWS